MRTRGRDIRIGRHHAFEYAVAIEGRTDAGQDRVAVVHVPAGLIIALADGAGGTANGTEAAEAVIKRVQQEPARAPTDLLYELDDPQRLGGGQTTGVIVTVGKDRVHGASVGDSGAWLIADATVVDLTSEQRRKPLLGSGCTPVAFDRQISDADAVLVASDGLLRYAKQADIARLALDGEIQDAVRALVELVRLPSGRLQDDVSIVLCRRVRTP